MAGDNAFYDGPIVPVDAYAIVVAFALIVLWPVVCAVVRLAVVAVVAFLAWADTVRVGPRPRPRSKLPPDMRRAVAAVPNAAERAALAVALSRSVRRARPRPAPRRASGLEALFLRWAV